LPTIPCCPQQTMTHSNAAEAIILKLDLD